MPNYLENPKTGLDLFRQKVYIIIYGVNTPAGKAFDVGLLIMIFLSVFTIVLETVEGVDQIYHKELIFFRVVFYHCIYYRVCSSDFCQQKTIKVHF